MKFRTKFKGFQVKMSPNGGVLMSEEKSNYPNSMFAVDAVKNCADINLLERDISKTIVSVGELCFDMGEIEVEIEMSAEEMITAVKCKADLYDLYKVKVKDAFDAFCNKENHSKIVEAGMNIFTIIMGLKSSMNGDGPVVDITPPNPEEPVTTAPAEETAGFKINLED